jgi:hypothetical protein
MVVRCASHRWATAPSIVENLESKQRKVEHIFQLTGEGDRLAATAACEFFSTTAVVER